MDGSARVAADEVRQQTKRVADAKDRYASVSMALEEATKAAEEADEDLRLGNGKNALQKAAQQAQPELTSGGSSTVALDRNLAPLMLEWDLRALRRALGDEWTGAHMLTPRTARTTTRTAAAAAWWT